MQFDDSDKQDAERRVAEYRRDAERGDSEAQWRIGWCYRQAKGVDRDFRAAVEWFRRSAEQGDAEGIYSLARCYQDGVGVEPNDADAAAFFQQAAELAHPAAQFALGECYWRGTGVAADDATAFAWFEKAAAWGDTRAQKRLRVAQLPPETRHLLARLQGFWRVVESESDDGFRPENRAFKNLWSFEIFGDQCETRRLSHPDENPKWQLKLTVDCLPQLLDMTTGGETVAAETWPGIVVAEADQVYICFAPPGGARPKEFVTLSEPEQVCFEPMIDAPTAQILARNRRKLAAARTDQKRFDALDKLAEVSFRARNLADAKAYAEQLVAVARQLEFETNQLDLPTTPPATDCSIPLKRYGKLDYGMGLFNGNSILSRVALCEGRIDDARQYLLAAGESPGWPHGHPDMKLAKELLKRNERTIVAQFLDRCARNWRTERSRAAQWRDHVLAGQDPDFVY